MAKDRRAMVNPFAGIKSDKDGETQINSHEIAQEETQQIAATSSEAVTSDSLQIDDKKDVISKTKTREAKAVSSKKINDSDASEERREFTGFRLPVGLVDRANSVAWSRQMTLTEFVERSIRDSVIAAEKQNGGPLPVVRRRKLSRRS